MRPLAYAIHSALVDIAIHSKRVVKICLIRSRNVKIDLSHMNAAKKVNYQIRKKQRTAVKMSLVIVISNVKAVTVIK